MKTLATILIAITVVGCASNVQYKRNCWGEAISSAISARHAGYEYRIAWNRDLSHAWNEVYVDGAWYRTWSNGNYFVDITGHNKYHANKYFDLNGAFEQTFKWRLPGR